MDVQTILNAPLYPHMNLPQIHVQSVVTSWQNAPLRARISKSA